MSDAANRMNWSDVALMTSSVLLVGLLVAKLFTNYGEALDASMRAQCRADQGNAATASAMIAMAEEYPAIADKLDDQIAHLVDLTAGRTPQQIAALPQCREAAP